MTWPTWILLAFINICLLGGVIFDLALASHRVVPEHGSSAARLLLFLVIAWFLIDSIPK